MTLTVDPAQLYIASDMVVSAASGLHSDSDSGAGASVKVVHTGTPEGDSAQADAGLALINAAIRHENTLRQLGVNLGLASIAYDTTEYKASMPDPPKIDHSQPTGPVA